jgi:hypothetical protein
MTTFSSLRFESLPTRRARSAYLYPPGTGWLSYTPRQWVSFSSPPTTLTAMVPPPHVLLCVLAAVVFLITPRHGPPCKTPFPSVPSLLPREPVYLQSLVRNECFRAVR